MITMFYLIRLTTLLFYVLCVYIAIKNSSKYKMLYGMLACMPMFIQIGISISYDAFANGLSLIIISYFDKWYFSEEKINRKDYIFAFLTCLALAPAKVLYGFFSFLFFFVPANRFGGKKNKIVASLILCMPALYEILRISIGPLTLMFHYIKKWFIDMTTVRAEDLLSEANNNSAIIKNDVLSVPTETFTLRYMFTHINETITIFVRTIRYKIKYWFYGSIGRTLSGDSLVLPIEVTYISILCVFASSIIGKGESLSMPLRFVMLAICVMVGMYALVGMFVSWTDVNQNIIEDYGGIIVEGIQGRYFCPVLPYLFSIFRNKKIGIPEKYSKYIILVYLLVFFEIVLYVLSYTFVN